METEQILMGQKQKILAQRWIGGSSAAGEMISRIFCV